MNDFLINRRCDILLAIGNDEKYLMQISKETRYMDYGMPIITKQFEAYGLVKRRKEGRRVYVKLTPKGKRLVKHIKKLKQLLK